MAYTFTVDEAFSTTFEGKSVNLKAGEAFQTDDECQLLRFMSAFRTESGGGVREEKAGDVDWLKAACKANGGVQIPPPPIPTPTGPPPKETTTGTGTSPSTEDSPGKQGAPQVNAPGQTSISDPGGRLNRDLLKDLYWRGGSSPPPTPQEVIDRLDPPPAPGEDLDAYVKRLLRNDPEPGKPHPSGNAPTARTPAAKADPVELSTGTFTVDVVDLVVPTACIPIAMSRSYRSGRPYYGPFGFGWDHPYNVYLRELDDGGIALWTGQGHEEPFQLAPVSGWEARPGFAARLERSAAAGGDVYLVTFPGGNSWRFERPAGWGDAERIPLTAILDRHGNTVRVAYGPLDQVTSVLDEAGRGLLFEYGSCELLERVSDHTGTRVVHYEHDLGIEHLVRVILQATAQYPDGLRRCYVYDTDAEQPAMRHNIVRIYDADDRLIVETEYGGADAGWEFNRVVRQRLAGFEYEFGYEQLQVVWPDPQFIDIAATQTFVRPPDGSLHTYTFNYRGEVLDQRCRLGKDRSFRVVAAQQSYDADGNVTETVGPDGLRTFFTYDSASLDPCARRNLLRVEMAAPLSGLIPSRIVSRRQYDPRFQFPTSVIDESGAETRYRYDFDVVPIGATGRLRRIELPSVVLVDGTSQQSVLLQERNARGQVTAIVSAEGRRTGRTYHSGGILDGFAATETIDPAGARLTSQFTYDAAGFLAQIEAPGGRVTRYVFNALGQVEQTDAPEVDGQTARQRRWYDDSGSPVRVERPAGSLVDAGILPGPIVDEYERDEAGCVHRVTLAANTDQKRVFLQRNDHEGLPVSTWDAMEMRTDRVYGENGALLHEIAAVGDPVTRTTSYAHDRAGRVVRQVGPWGDVTRFEYDLWGRLQRVLLPNGAIRTFDFGANDLLLEERVEEIPAGETTPRLLRKLSYEYDQRGRLAVSTVASWRDDPTTATPLRTRCLYNRDDQPVALQLPRGAETQYEYDTAGRILRGTDPHGNTQRYEYNAAGDLGALTSTEVVDGVPRSVTRQNSYDARGQLLSSTCLGFVTTTRYDDRGLSIERRTASGRIVRSQFDALGQATENVVDPGGLALRSRYEYDPNGRVSRYIDPTGSTTAWTRDPLGRAASVMLPDGAIWSFLEDLQAHTTGQQTPAGNRVVYEFADDENRPSKMSSAAAPGQEPVPAHAYGYDGLGRLVRATVGPDEISRRYDSLGRLVEETARGRTVWMGYNDALGTMDVFFPDNRHERTEYNTVGQPTRVSLVAPGLLGGVAGESLLEITYAASGRPASLHYGNGVEGTLVRDDLDRIIRVEYRKGGALLGSCRLRYDEGGRRGVIQYLGGLAHQHAQRFDEGDRLVETRHDFPLALLPDLTDVTAHPADVAAARAAAAGMPGMGYLLDNADTRVKTMSLDGGGVDQTYASAVDHRITAVGANAITYTADGQRTGDARYLYELDALNRVRRVRDRATGTIVAEMQYDALSRVAAGADNGQPFERWFTDATQIHEESGAAGSARQQSTHPLWSAPAWNVDATGVAYVHQDEGLSTMCVTDGSGAVLERHRFDVFGKSDVFAADGVTPVPSPRSEPRWRGMPALGATTLFRTPARLYDPETGAFTSRDPLLYADGPSAYVYAGHNPVDFMDPTGLAKEPLGSGGSVGEQRSGLSKWLHDDSLKMGWYEPPTKGDILTENLFSDTGSIAGNYGKNLWFSVSNLMASVVNVPFEIVTALDDRMRHSMFSVEWEALAVMGPMMKTMGLAAELPGGISYLSYWLRTNQTLKNLSLSAIFATGVTGVGGASRLGKAGGAVGAATTDVLYVGGYRVDEDARGAKYAIRATGTMYEDWFEVTKAGRTQKVRPDGVVNLFLVEAKEGLMLLLNRPDKEAAILRQARGYLDLVDSGAFGFRGTRYAVSTEQGWARLVALFEREFPDAMASGKLGVFWVP